MMTSNEPWLAPTYCEKCHKVFNFDLNDEKKDHLFCSPECEHEHYQQLYQKRISIIPLLYRKIDCDYHDLVMNGIYNSLILMGPSGVGKSVAAGSMSKEIVKDPKRRVYWINYARFINKLQCLYRRSVNEISPYEYTKKYMSFNGTLVLDDFGAEKLSDSVRNTTYSIISYREEYNLHTIITTNLSLDEIDKLNGSRISSRIVGFCKPIKLDGKDRRLQK